MRVLPDPAVALLLWTILHLEVSRPRFAVPA
jgi:hypothetical protein